jgi:peptidoglycan/xylan/chitin deacetylase (PgdA/CDA1 family)
VRSLNLTSASAHSATHYLNTTTTSTIQTLPPVGTPTGTKTRSSKTVKSRTTKIGTKTHILPTTHKPTPTSTGSCQNLLVDDWESQSRLTFLGYNALLEPSSDDGTMQSITVSDHTVHLLPINASSYFYTELPCVDGNTTYGGASLRVKAAKGTKFSLALYSQSTCGGDDDEFSDPISTTDLGWTFDGTMQLFSIPFAKFTGFDPGHLSTIFLQSFSGPVTFGPIELYCGTTVQEYVATSTPVPQFTSYSVPAPTGTATPLILESGSSLGSANTNAAGFWHGADEGLSVTYRGSHMTISANDSDYAWYTTVSDTCADMTSYSMSYLHIQYSGSNKFTVAMQQHNQWCNTSMNPYPETWDSLEAGRYGNSSDMFFPVDHFKINMTRVAAVALKGFYDFEHPTDILKVELVNSVPRGWSVPNKLPSGDLLFACKRPNSFAFAIDDGQPQYAQEVMQTIKDENITVTFFTLGAALDDPTTNLSNVYTEMRDLGHQIATHSFTHPKMEGLPDDGSIDWEYNNDLATTSDVFGGLKTKYFRPPFGTEGARMRQRLAMSMGIDDPQIVMWSVDVADWMWAETSTPEKQIEAFKSDLAKGGNLVVMHYLYPSTVSYLKTFIQLAKATGKQVQILLWLSPSTVLSLMIRGSSSVWTSA